MPTSKFTKHIQQYRDSLLPKKEIKKESKKESKVVQEISTNTEKSSRKN